MRFRITGMLLIGALILMLSGCSKTISTDVISSTESTGLVAGANEFRESYCITDSGILYGSGCLIRYYDLETDVSYILCDKANCTHSNENCSAWYENELSAYGIALYQDTVYCLKWSESSNTYNLVSMGVTGNNQRTVATIDGGNYEIGAWHISAVEDVYYRKGYAWIGFTYNYMESANEIDECSQWIAVDLSTGSIDELNELSTDGVEYSVEAITDDVVVLSKRVASLEKLSEEAFYEAYENGEFGTEFQDSEDPYYEYQAKWYSANVVLKDILISHNMLTGEDRLLEEALVTVSLTEDGYLNGTKPKYLFLGDYNGLLLCEEMATENSEARYFLWNPKTSEQQDFLTIRKGQGGSLAWETGSVYSELFDGSGLLYCEYTDDDKAEIFLINLETMMRQKLMVDERNISFRIVGESSDYLIGKVYNNWGYAVYKISKEDYLSGNLNRKIKLQI